jgi:hypothetical protein
MDHLTSNTPVQEVLTPPVEAEVERFSLELCGRITNVAAGADDILLSLMAGGTVLGSLRPDAAKSKDTDTIRFSVSDFGLSTFAEMTGLNGVEVLVDAAGEVVARADIDARSTGSCPLGMRHGLGQILHLVDIWLEGTRNLNLRFEGTSKGGKSVDIYQCVGSTLIAVAYGRPVSGLTAIATVPLINPFEPVLLIFKGEDRSIDAVDFVPFPSLSRGGLHAAERLITSFGADDVSDTAALSAELVAAWRERRANASRCVATIDMDPAIETGIEPVLDRELIKWITGTLGIRLSSGPSTPSFIKEFVSDQPDSAAIAGHTLHLPADCVPTLGSLLRPLPDDAAPQRITGSYGISEWNRRGRVWSVWEPPLTLDLDALQFAEAPRVAPMLTVHNSGPGRPVPLQWPLALAFRDPRTRIGHASPFEVAADFEGSLLRGGPVAGPARLAVLVLAGTASEDPVPLLESLARQSDVEIEELVVCTHSQGNESELAAALARMFPDRHSILGVPQTAGRIEQIAAARERVASNNIVVADGATVVPDPRALATLARLLEAPEVGSAGCLLRQATDKMTPVGAGYSLSEIALRAVPQLAFAAIDPTVWRGPSTHPVIANSIALALFRREILATVPTAGSTSMRPESDDLLLGMHVIAGGRLNLCTTVVSAFTAAAVRPSQASISVPYRLDPAELARMVESATIVQRVA